MLESCCTMPGRRALAEVAYQTQNCFCTAMGRSLHGCSCLKAAGQWAHQALSRTRATRLPCQRRGEAPVSFEGISSGSSRDACNPQLPQSKTVDLSEPPSKHPLANAIQAAIGANARFLQPLLTSGHFQGRPTASQCILPPALTISYPCSTRSTATSLQPCQIQGALAEAAQ